MPAGETTFVAPEPEGNHVYDVAPLTVKVIDWPLQIVVLAGVTVTEGAEVTFTVAVFGALTQFPLLPVTV